MKKTNPNLLLALVLLAIPFGYAAYVYPSLPVTIPTHFNLKGEADGFGAKDSIFLGPGIIAGVGLFTFLLLSNIKKFDPKKYQATDDGLFKKLALAMVAFLSLLALIITFSSTNHSVNITKLFLPSKLGFICFLIVTAIMVIIPTVFSYRMFKNGNQVK